MPASACRAAIKKKIEATATKCHDMSYCGAIKTVHSTVYKNSSGDEIANVNFFTTTSYNTSKYNPLLNIQHDGGRGAASGCGLVVLVRRFSYAPICCNEVRF